MLLMPDQYLYDASEVAFRQQMMEYIKENGLEPQKNKNKKKKNKNKNKKTSTTVLQPIDKIGVHVAYYLAQNLGLDYRNPEYVFETLPWMDPGEVIKLEDAFVLDLASFVRRVSLEVT